MAPKDQDVAVAYQNKDIVSKIFGDRMKGKPLSLFGLETDLKVVDVRPTNLPIVQARELRMDNLFELEDGSVAILDYESEYRESNFTKYGRYIMDVIDRYLKEGSRPDIHMMVIYTADTEEAGTVLTRTACRIQVEASYLSEIPSEEWLERVRGQISEDTITDEVLMHLILLPLTYKGVESKQEAVIKCVELARQIKNKEQETFVLAGILAFTDKVITEATRQYIKEVLGMTQVGRMLIEEGRQEGRQEGIREGRQEGRQEGIQEGRQKGDIERARKTALTMLKRGTSAEEVAEILELPLNTIRDWAEEACAAV